MDSPVEVTPRPLSKRPLANITRADLEPLWMRREIPTRTIAEALGVTRQGLSLKARTLGLPSRAGNQAPNTYGDDDLFRRMWIAGVRSSEIAKAFGYTHQAAVGHRRAALGLPARTRTHGGKTIGGWKETISLARFLEIDLAERMAAARAAERH